MVPKWLKNQFPDLKSHSCHQLSTYLWTSHLASVVQGLLISKMDTKLPVTPSPENEVLNRYHERVSHTHGALYSLHSPFIYVISFLSKIGLWTCKSFCQCREAFLQFSKCPRVRFVFGLGYGLWDDLKGQHMVPKGNWVRITDGWWGNEGACESQDLAETCPSGHCRLMFRTQCL